MIILPDHKQNINAALNAAFFVPTYFKSMNKNLMNISCLFILLVSLIIPEYGFSQTVEHGVSESLAHFRKQHISNLTYALHFRVSATSQQMVAEETIRFDYASTDKPLQLDFKATPHRVSDLWVNGKSLAADHRDEHLLIPAGRLRARGNEVTIHFVSVGNPVKIDTNGLAYSFFVPAKAREVFPCFDQPDLKAVFSLKLTVPRGWMAVSNGALADSSTSSSESVFSFAPTPSISTYLFAFAAGKFSRFSEERKGRTINFYYRETDRVKIDSSLKKCMDLNFKALDYLSDYLGMPYPFPKFDFVEIPRFSVSGMEHPGAVFYNGRTLFLDVASATEEFARANTIGHEVSHMWFGDDVTMRWFNDVWLKEVFANYLGNRFASSISPQNDLKKKAVLSNLPAAFSIDRYPSSEPINRKLPNLNQAGLVYGSITYNKAPIAIHQLALLMGEQAFRKGLKDYVKTFRGSNADFGDLMKVFQKHTREDLRHFSDAWIDQPGRPVIRCRMDTAAGKIKQLTFLQHGEWNKDQFWPQRFSIMLAYDGGIFQTIEVNFSSALKNVPDVAGLKVPNYILFNSGGEGYGVFPINKNVLNHFSDIPLAEARAATVINLFERMLGGRRFTNEGDYGSTEISPPALLEILLRLVSTEPDKQILERELRYLEAIYWRYLSSTTRAEWNTVVESGLRNAMLKQVPNNRTAVLRTIIRVAESANTLDTLYSYWNSRTLPPGVVFGSNDWSNLARELAVRDYRTSEVLQRQRDSITDAGSRRSFAYQMPALSSDVAVRDSFFNAIVHHDGRPNDNDVAAAISWLHHPLRQKESIRYISPALKVLSDVLHTSDIFFPTLWINNMLDNYANPVANSILDNYLDTQPTGVPPLLLQKVKQAADAVALAMTLH